MDRQKVLDLYFVDARARLIDLAAFLDRLERAEGAADFRAEAFDRALRELAKPGADRARRVLLALSDPTYGAGRERAGQGRMRGLLRPGLTCVTSSPTRTWSAAPRTTTRPWRWPVAPRCASRLSGRGSTAAARRVFTIISAS